MIYSLNEVDIAEKVNEILTANKIVSKDCIDCARQYDRDKNIDKIKGAFESCLK